MAQTHHGTAGPATPVTSTILGLLNRQLREDETFQQALKAAPLYGFPELDGSAITWAGYLGLDLSAGADLTVPIPWQAGLPAIKMAFNSVNFVTRRYPVGKFDLPRVVTQKWKRGFQIDYVTQLMEMQMQIARDIFGYLVFAALGTTGNYATHSDPGNGTSASYDWIRLVFDSSIEQLSDNKKLEPKDTHIFVGTAIWPYLQVSDQLRNSPAVTRQNMFGTPEAVNAFISSFTGVPAENIHRVRGTYKAASGTVTKMFDDDALAFVTSKPGIGNSFLKATIPDEAGSVEGGMIRLRGPKFIEETDSDEYYADLAVGVNLQDTTNGVLRHGLGS